METQRRPKKSKRRGGRGTESPEQPRLLTYNKRVVMNDRARPGSPRVPCEVFHASQKRTLSELRTDPAKQKKSVEQKKKAFAVRSILYVVHETDRQELWSGIWFFLKRERERERGRFPDRVVWGQVKFVLSTNGVPAVVALSVAPFTATSSQLFFFFFSNGDSSSAVGTVLLAGQLGPAQRTRRNAPSMAK